MHPLLQYPFDANGILNKRRRIRRELTEKPCPRVKRAVAVLGGSTTHDVVDMLELFLLDRDIEPSFYESEFGRFYEDACFGDVTVDGQKPDVALFYTGRRNITRLPTVRDSEAEVDALLESEFRRFETAWESVQSRYGCAVIQNNFEMPTYRLLGNRDGVDVHGAVSFLRRLNERFAEYARTHRNFYIHDIDYLSAAYGLDRWSDEQAWYLYKYQTAVPAIPLAAHSLSLIIASLAGKNKKALALDLDNTLWGGVVGDDGPEGLEIGHETAVGQSYRAFQEYVKAQKDIGVILAVNSKNDRDNALAGLRHPEGALRPEDFAVIRANWQPKDRNIVEIAETLNILPNSIVFVDDNPAERALVGAQLPDVAAPDIGRVEDYIRVLDRSGFFEATSLSEDDLKRSDMYTANAARQEAAAAFADYGEYLASLNMRALIRPFDSVYFERITQLTNKSNQFNLTTRRYTQPEIEAAATDGRHIALYGKLYDRFGDNGVVAVTIGCVEDKTLHIELWLMSCRVLKRDMEQAMLDALVDACRARGLDTAVGYYYPTAKNGMVRDFYGDMGFEKREETADGASVWQMALDGYQKRNRYIDIVQEEEQL